jgi:AraC-like DNA-binding protein
MMPVKYLNIVRIKKAVSLLAESDLPIFMFAIRASFTDLTQFNKQFKKFSGQTPSSFRKSAVATSKQSFSLKLGNISQLFGNICGDNPLPP